MNTREPIKKFAPIVFYLLFGIFLVVYVRSIDFQSLRGIGIDWRYLLLSTIFSIAFRFFGAFIWFDLLKGLGAVHLNKVELVYVYAKSWLGRYIPGTAPWILGKIYFASKHGVSKSKLAVSSLLEAALQIVAALILSLSILPFDSRFNTVNPAIRTAMIAVLVVCVVVLIPKVFNYLLSSAHQIIRRAPLPAEHHTNARTLLRGAGMYILGSVINGAALFFIAKSLYGPLSYNDFLFILGIGAFSGAAGMLAIFVPSGIGVRDGIQLLLLSLVVPGEYALAITIMARLWDVAADLVFFGLCRAVRRSHMSQ